MACTLNNVINSLDKCEENFSGVGSRMYFFLCSDLDSIPTRSDKEAAFTPDSFSELNGKLYAVDIKEQSGKVTSESTADGGGFSNVCQFTVAKNMEEYAFILRTLNNVKFGAFCPDGTGGYYAFYSVMGSATMANSGDSGDSYDSDHGHTTTLTAAPMYYPMMKWNPISGGKITLKGETLYVKSESGSYTSVQEGDLFSSANEYFVDESGKIPAALDKDYTVTGGNAINLDTWCKTLPTAPTE